MQWFKCAICTPLLLTQGGYYSVGDDLDGTLAAPLGLCRLDWLLSHFIIQYLQKSQLVQEITLLFYLRYHNLLELHFTGFFVWREWY